MKTGVIESAKRGATPAPLIRLVPAPHSALSPLDALDALNPARAYLDSLAEGSARSMRANLERAAACIGVRFDDVPWHLIRARHVESVIGRMRNMRVSRGKGTPRKLSPATVNCTLAALKGMCRRSFLLGHMSGDEYQLVREVRRVRGERIGGAGRALTAAELRDLLRACDRDKTPAGRRDACVFALMAGAGLRRSEVAALDLADWRSRSHSLRVHGKGDKERIVYLEDGGARRALRDWIAARGPEPGPLVTPVDHVGRVILRRITDQAVYNLCRKRRREARLRRPFSPHDLRRTFATDLLELGAEITDVQKLLGHAREETTAAYRKGGEHSKRDAARKVKLPFGVGRRGKRRRRRRWRRK